jgi:hypothetical protein
MQLDRYRGSPAANSGGTGDLADILERVLDKGVVVAGDIVINLLDIELLTIKLRLLIASADTAREMGIDWWESDPFLSSKARSREESQELSGRNGSTNGAAGELQTPAESESRVSLDELAGRLERIESALSALASPSEAQSGQPPGAAEPDDPPEPSGAGEESR